MYHHFILRPAEAVTVAFRQLSEAKLTQLVERTPLDVTLPHEVVKRSTLGGLSLVRAWREYLGLSQAEVARRMGISQPSYAKMEGNETKNRPATLKKIAEAS